MKSQCVSIVVPPPIAAPCTAATIGFSNLTNASIRSPCGNAPGLGGFLRKSTTSLPALNTFPMLCQSTTRIASSLSAWLRMSARFVYMADVIAFFWAGRLSWTRRMPSVRSVRMSLIVCSFVCCSSPPFSGVFLDFRHRAARAQVIDALGVKSQVTEDLIGVLAEVGGTPRRHLGDAVHLNRAADRRGELAACALERNDDVIRLELWVVDNFLRPAHRSDREAAERLVPMRHWLCAEDFVENRDEFVPVRRELRRIGESRICQEVRTPDGFRRIRQLVGCKGENKPRVVGGAIYIRCGAQRIAAIVQTEELCVAQRGLDRDACRPDALGEERGRDVRPLAGALAAVERRDDRRIDTDGRRVVSAAADRPGRRRAGIARHRQQATARPVRREIEARQSGIGTLFAEARKIRVDQPRIPLHDVGVFELQFLARRVRRVDHEHVRPLAEFLKNLLSARRLQVEHDPALVAVREMKGVSVFRRRLRGKLMRVSPQVTGRWFDFDHVGAEVRENYGGAGARNEGREVYDFESGKDVVACHWVSPKSSWLLQRPRNCGARFSRKADVPSFLSSVPAHRPK